MHIRTETGRGRPLRLVVPVALVCAALVAGCGRTQGERALSGGGIGAAVGAAGAAITGGSAVTGAAVGAGVGAATGALTRSDQINLD